MLFRSLLGENVNLENIVIVAPDEGAVKQSTRISSRLGCSAATIFKSRNKPNEIGIMKLMGEVSGKLAIIVDDLIDTGGTACKACQILLENGATEVYMLACHGLFSGPAIERISNSNFNKVIVTNTLDQDRYLKNIQLYQCNKFEYIDVSWMCAEAISRLVEGKSISHLYNDYEYFLAHTGS